MDQKDQIDYEDLQKDKRLKNLELSLRHSDLKLNMKTQTIPWSSCSSVNGDPSNLNSTFNSQVTKTGSEILTVSRNLKGLLHIPSKHMPMATSSVKKFSETEENMIDSAIMPPPSSHAIRTPLKRSAPVDVAPERVKFRRQATHDKEHFSQEKQTHVNLNSSKDCSNSQKEKVDRHFYHWRVILNDQGKLLIRGFVNNEIWARSKPVAKAMSPTKLESVFKHKYYLHGNITDNKNELPRYVYLKFYNGFPEDWRNVREVWKSYIAQENKENFRWPTEVTYSDDDLISEIIDTTQVPKIEKKYQESSFMEKLTTQRSSGYSSDFLPETDRNIRENPESDKTLRNQSVQTDCDEDSKENEKCIDKEKILHESQVQCDLSTDQSCSDNSCTAIKNLRSLHKIVLPNEFAIIMNNLLHEKCPKEYIQHVTRTFDSLKNILSVNMDETDENVLKKNMDPITDFERKYSVCFSSPQSIATDGIRQTENNEQKINEKLMEQISDKTGNEINAKLTETPVNEKLNSNIEEKNENSKRKQVRRETDSESENTGVLKKSDKNEKLLQTKIDHKYCKLDRIGKTQTRDISEERKINLFNDSSISILDDENLSENERILRSNSQNFRPGEINLESNDSTTKTKVDPLRENRDDNKGSCKIPVFSKTSSETEKLIDNKENMDNQDIFRQKEISEFPDGQTQNFPANDSDHQQLQKPRIINTEKVNFRDFKKPVNQISTSEQNRNSRGAEEQIDSKRTEMHQNSKDKLADTLPEDLNHCTYGTEENPKILKNWTQMIKCQDNKYHLAFKGILINNGEKTLKRKYKTSRVIRRISATIFETVDHQFYKLFGEMNMTNHDVPKELLPHCRTGCPVNINRFIAKWLKLLRESDTEECLQEAIEDKKHIPVSSRGRSILPPLNFWSGERVEVKNGGAVYKSGDPKEKFVTSLVDGPGERPKPQEQAAANETAKPKSVSHSKEKRHAKKNQVAQKLYFETSDSEAEKSVNTSSRISNFYRLRNRQTVSYENDDNDDDDDAVYKNYSAMKPKTTKTPKRLTKAKNSGPTIQVTYKRIAQSRNSSFSSDQESIF